MVKVYHRSILQDTALDREDGTLRWRFQWREHVAYDSVAVEDGIIYVVADAPRGGYQGHLYALDAQTGQILWRFPEEDASFISLDDGIGGCVDTTATVVDGVVYFSDITCVYAIDIQTRSLKWRFRHGGIYPGAPQVAFGHVYVMTYTSDSRIYILDAQTGQPVCEPIYLGYWAAFALADQQLFLANHDLEVYDALTGRYLWSYSHRRLITSHLVVTDDIILCIGTDKNKAYTGEGKNDEQEGTKNELVALRRSHPQLEWTLPIDGRFHRFCLGDGIIYLTASPQKEEKQAGAQGVLSALDLNSRQLIWQFAPGQQLMTPSVDRGSVFCASKEGTLYAFHRAGFFPSRDDNSISLP